MATDNAKRGGQRRAAGLERGNIALAVALVEDLAERVLHGVSEPGELEELKADGQVHSDCGCQDQKRPSPQPVGNRHHDVDDKHILPPK